MPNFWSRGWQFLEEKFGGEITTDKDFENILKRIETTEKGLSSLRAVFQNFNLYIEKFCSFFEELNKAINLIYEHTPYYSFIEEFVCKQQIINTHFEELSKLIIKLFSRTSEWDRIFESAKNQLIERENKRKIYDHYEKKMLKIRKSSKDQKYIERNEEKFTKAASEYVEISEKIYQLLNDSLKLSWKLTNPIVSELIIGEQKLFDGISSTLSCFKENSKRFEELEYSFNDPNSKRKNFIYDPLKYMKEKDFIKQISIKKCMSFPTPQFKEDDKKRKTVYKCDNILKKEISGNINNILSQARSTNSFGNLPEKKMEEFFNIEDDFL